ACFPTRRPSDLIAGANTPASTHFDGQRPPLQRYRVDLAAQGTMTAESNAVGRLRCCDGDGEVFAGFGASADSPIRLTKLRSASGVTGSGGTSLVCRR